MKNKIKENLQSDFVEKKLEIENEEQPTQENTVEKKTSIVMKESKLKSTVKNIATRGERKRNLEIAETKSNLWKLKAKEKK